MTDDAEIIERMAELEYKGEMLSTPWKKRCEKTKEAWREIAKLTIKHLRSAGLRVELAEPAREPRRPVAIHVEVERPADDRPLIGVLWSGAQNAVMAAKNVIDEALIAEAHKFRTPVLTTTPELIQKAIAAARDDIIEQCAEEIEKHLHHTKPVRGFLGYQEPLFHAGLKHAAVYVRALKEKKG